MSYKAIYAYPWDIAEIGVSAAIDRFLALGLDTVTITGSYHAGKFLRPHGKGGKVYFPEDGTIYFKPDLSRYGAIKPVENAMLASGQDIVRELVGQSRMATNVWLVLLHNTRLGLQHPESVVANAFGDRYVYNLCPSAPEARAYAIGLARDVTESYPVSGVSLETPGFLPYAHGYHHEFALNRPNRWLDSQLGLCFCAHCRAGAKSAGVRVEALKRQVEADVEAYLASDIDFPSRHGGSVLARGRAQRRRPPGLSRLAMLSRDLARARNSRRGAQGRDGRGHSFGRPTDRGRLV